MRQIGLSVSALVLLLAGGMSAILCTSCDDAESVPSNAAVDSGGPDLADQEDGEPEGGGDPTTILDLTIEWYSTDATLDGHALAPTNGGTARGLTISNPNDTDVELDSITITPRFSCGFDGSGVEILAYLDEDLDGDLDGHYRAAYEGETLPESFTENRLSDLQALAATTLLDFSTLGSPAIPAGGSISLGLLVWNNSEVGSHAYLDVDAADGRTSVPDQDGDGMEDEVPVSGESKPVPPNDPPTFFGEAACKVKLLCDPVWKLCHMPDLAWTDENEFQLSNDCEPYKTEITFTAKASVNGGAEVDAQLKNLTNVVFENNAVKSDIVNVMPEAAPDCVDMIKTTITPIEGQASSDCESTIVAGYATVCCPGGNPLIKLDSSKASGAAGCKGTSIVVRFFPIVCCNTRCNNNLTAGTPPVGAMEIVKGTPSGEDIDTKSKPKGCPEGTSVRVDPRSIYADMTQPNAGMDSKSAINMALATLAMAGAPNEGSMISDASMCMSSACFGLCVTSNSSGVTAHGSSHFRYTFTPKACGEKILMSQFKIENNMVVAGSIGLEEHTTPGTTSDLYPIDSTSGARYNAVTTTNNGMMTHSINRDFETSMDTGYVFFRPTETSMPDPASETESYPCSYMVVSACKRPLIALKICPMKKQNLNIALHFPKKDGAGNNRAADFGGILKADLESRLKELFSQACIDVSVNAPTGYDNGPNDQNADNASEDDVVDTFDAVSGTSTSTLNIILVNTLGTGAVASQLTRKRKDENGNIIVQNGNNIVDTMVVLPLEFGGSPNDNMAGDDDFVKGMRLICSQVPTHEVAHALGLAKDNSHPEGDTQSVPDETSSASPRPMIDADRRIMATGTGTELSKQPRYCWPSFLRFSCMLINGAGESNEVEIMRKQMKAGNTFKGQEVPAN